MELLAGLVGLVGGALLAVLALRTRAPQVPGRPVEPPVRELRAADVVAALPAAVAVLDAQDDVVLTNRSAQEMGVVRDGRLAVAELLRLVRETRRTGSPRDAEVPLTGARLGRVPEAVRARLAPVAGHGHVALLVEDATEAQRVEAVRRDFVANVSHELKTPVGALSVLGEALEDAGDDPVAVRRFAGRVRHEAGRLARLVQELLDLSRLQGADPLPEPVRVPVDKVVAEAVDRTRTLAASRDIALVTSGPPGLEVLGSEAQLVMAVANLLDNAVAYSPDATRVAVSTGLVAGAVEISVSDQGIGIAPRDRSRIFERFYRADPARSRRTGGTGLGLAIVKHVATNHGGGVDVWSVEGAGSTFTLRLPPAPPERRSAAPGPPAERSAGSPATPDRPAPRGVP